jgi:hypothetical protein
VLFSQEQWQDNDINRIKKSGGKMNKLLSLTILAVMLALGAQGAWADGPFPTAMTDGTFGPVGSVTPNSSTGQPEIYNAINLLLGTSYTDNAQVDSLEYTGNASTWATTGGNASGAVIGLSADNSNTLEVYNPSTPGTLVSPLGTSFTGSGFTGNGTASNPYAGATAAVPGNTQFGFAINTVGICDITGSCLTPPAGTDWYSNPTLNSDSMDHMLVYNLSALTGKQVDILNPTTGVTSDITLDDPYLIAFEDIPLSFDGAFSDMDYNDMMVLVNGVAPVPEPITFALFGVGLLAMAGFALRRKFSFLSNVAFAG